MGFLYNRLNKTVGIYAGIKSAHCDFEAFFICPLVKTKIKIYHHHKMGRFTLGVKTRA